MLVQIIMGVITAHYGVEGNGFYGLKIDHVLPHSVTRKSHVQVGIFWIATAWLAAGLFIGPLVSGFEPKFQALGVHVLLVGLLVIVAGSFRYQAEDVPFRPDEDHHTPARSSVAR
jgi:nitric oxide reductase subunit B